MKKKPTKKPTKGTGKPFWDGRSRVSNNRYRENFDSIFKNKKQTARNFIRNAKMVANI